MNKTLKIVSTLLMVTLLTVMLSNVVMASGKTSGINAGDIAGSLTGTATVAQSSVTNIGNQIIGIITTVGVVVAVVVLLVLGIKYMMGSASEKAEYKKTMIPYLVGAILIFGASAITKVVVSIGSGITA